MARISVITLKEQPDYYSLTIRKTINFMSEYANFTGDSLKRIADHLNTLGVLVSEGPIVCFHNMDLERLDVEVGFPVARHVEGRGEIQLNAVPAQKAVTAIDQGAYEEQDATLEEIFSFIQCQGFRPAGAIYYQYLNDTERPACEYLTKMLVPIQE